MDLLERISLREEDFNYQPSWLIEGFIPANMITSYYSGGGVGKTWLSYAIAKSILEMGVKFYYLDFDNSIGTLIDRGVKSLVLNYPDLKYVQRSKLDIEPIELINRMAFMPNIYKGSVILIDSLRDVINVHNDNATRDIMQKLQNLRDAGATIILVHHTTKNNAGYDGSNNIKNSLDCLFKAKRLPHKESFVAINLQVEKERARVKDCTFAIDTTTLSLERLELTKLSKFEEEFIDDMRILLEDSPRNKSTLLEDLGFEKSNKKARSTLKKFENIFYRCKREGRNIVYRML
jgi:archaellum biogenesis ATPase FlaH